MLTGFAGASRTSSGPAATGTGGAGGILYTGADPVIVQHPAHVAMVSHPDAALTMDKPRAPRAHAPAPTAASPGCSTSPCPMGITDYGVTSNSVTYTYGSTSVESFVDISSIWVNQTNSCLDPGAYNCMGFQSNWIDKGLVAHGHVGEYWTQDVAQVAYDSSCSSPCVSGYYSVTWLDNIWNFSYPGCYTSTGLGCMNANDLTGNGQSACSSSGGAPYYYYCVGPTVYGLYPPFTIWTYMSTGVSSGHSDVYFYGAVLTGNTYKYGTYYDSVLFNSGIHGGGTPKFHVQDINTPYGLPYDAEWDICGPAGGASVSIGSISAIMETYYHGLSNWVSIKHAWSSGYDTAETAYYVNMYAFAGFRPSGSAATGTENPQTSLW